VSAASLPLPTGAATAAKQPALGTAGTPSADVITVQGAASMTALKVDGSGVTQPVSGTVTVTQGTGTNLHTVVDSAPTTAVTNTGLSDLDSAIVADGAAAAANDVQTGGKGSGDTKAFLNCDGYAFYDASTNGATQLVALSAGKTIFVCGYTFTSSSTTANTVKLVYGTGTNCATGQTAMTPGVLLQ